MSISRSYKFDLHFDLKGPQVPVVTTCCMYTVELVVPIKHEYRVDVDVRSFFVVLVTSLLRVVLIT